jgi:hypothetical protein
MYTVSHQSPYDVMSFGNRSCNRIPRSNERIALISIAHHIQSFITQKDRPQYARISIAQINTHAMMSPACHLHEPRAPPSLFQFRKSHDLVDAMREDQTMANPYAWLSWARGNRNAVRRPPVERPVACGCFVSAWFKEKFVFALAWLACFGQLDVSQVVRCRCPWHGACLVAQLWG